MPPSPSRPVRLPIAALVVANAALACGPWLVRLAGSEAQVGPVGSAFWRLALSLPVLAVAARWERPAQSPRPRAFRGLAGLGGVLFALDLALWHLGILHTRLANATLLGNVTAVLFPVYGFVVARRWPSARQTIALALAGVGAALLLGRSYHLSARNLHGDLLCIGAGLCYTSYLIAIDRVRRTTGPVTTLAWAGAAGTPALLAAALASGDPLWPHSWVPLVLLAAGSQLVGQGLLLYAVGRVSSLVVGVMLLLQPVVASAIGWALYGERLGLPDLAGAVAIAAAVLLVRDTPRRLRTGEIGLSSGPA